MKTSRLILLGVVLILVSWAIASFISLNNTEVRLKNRGKAQQEVCGAYFDKMLKILQQKAGVTDQYKDGFKEIYTGLIGGRYNDEGKGRETFMKWIQESNPTFDTSLYKDLMASIDGERNGFFMEQEKLIDIDREHKDLRMVWPNSMFIGSRPDLGIVVIKSLKTDEAYKSGQENDLDLFKKK